VSLAHDERTLASHDLDDVVANADHEAVPGDTRTQTGFDQVAVASDLVDDTLRIGDDETRVSELGQLHVGERRLQILGPILVGEAVLAARERIAAVASDQVLHLPLGALAIGKCVKHAVGPNAMSKVTSSPARARASATYAPGPLPASSTRPPRNPGRCSSRNSPRSNSGWRSS